MTATDTDRTASDVVWDLVPVYSAMIEDLKADKFGTHGYSIQLNDNSVHLLHTKHISDDLWAQLEAVRKQIIDGSVKVEPVWDAPKVCALMTSVTDAPK